MSKRARYDQEIDQHGDLIESEPISSDEEPDQQDEEFIDKRGIYAESLFRTVLWNEKLEEYFQTLVFIILQKFNIPRLNEQIQKHFNGTQVSQDYNKVISQLFAMKEKISKMIEKSSHSSMEQAQEQIYTFSEKYVKRKAKQLLINAQFMSVEEDKGKNPSKKIKTQNKTINGKKIVEQAEKILEGKYPQFIVNLDRNRIDEYKKKIKSFEKNTKVLAEQYQKMKKQSIQHVVSQIQSCIDLSKYQSKVPEPPSHINLMKDQTEKPTQKEQKLTITPKLISSAPQTKNFIIPKTLATAQSLKQSLTPKLINANYQPIPQTERVAQKQTTVPFILKMPKLITPKKETEKIIDNVQKIVNEPINNIVEISKQKQDEMADEYYKELQKDLPHPDIEIGMGFSKRMVQQFNRQMNMGDETPPLQFDVYQLRGVMTNEEKDLFKDIKSIYSTKDGFFEGCKIRFNHKRSGQNIRPLHQAMFTDLKLEDYDQETQRFSYAIKQWLQYCDVNAGGKDEYKKYLREKFHIQNPIRVSQNVQYSAIRLQFWKSVTVLQIQKKTYGSSTMKAELSFKYGFVKTKWGNTFKSCPECDKLTEANKGSPMSVLACDHCRKFFSEYGSRIVASILKSMTFVLNQEGKDNYFSMISAKKHLIGKPQDWVKFASLQLQYNKPDNNDELQLMKQIKNIIPQKTIFAVIYPIMSRVINCFKLSQPNSKQWGLRLVFQQVVKANLTKKQNQRLFGLQKYQSKKEYISCFSAPIFGLLQSWESSSSKMVGTQGLRIWRFMPSSSQQKWICGNDLRQQNQIKKFIKPSTEALSDQRIYGKYINQLRTLFPIHEDCSQPTSKIFIDIMTICIDYVAGGLENNGRWQFSKTLHERPMQRITGVIKANKKEQQSSAAQYLCC